MSRDRENRVPRHLCTPSIRADDKLPQAQLDRAAHALRSQFGECIASFLLVAAALVIQFHVLQALSARLDTSERLVTFSAVFFTTTLVVIADWMALSLYIVARRSTTRAEPLRLSSTRRRPGCVATYFLASFTHSPRHSS